MDNCNGISSAAVYIRADEGISTGDFSDARVILVTLEDSRYTPWAHADLTRCYTGQAFDGPTFITIGAAAADSSLTKVSERYGVPLDDLYEFRARQMATQPAVAEVAHG